MSLNDPTTIEVVAKEAPSEKLDDAVEIAETIIEKAHEIAGEIRDGEDKTSETLDLIYEAIAEIKECRADILNAENRIVAALAEIRVAQVVEEIAEDVSRETSPIEAEPEPAPVVVEVNQAAEGGEIEKETVVDTNPAPAEERKPPKPERKWL